MSFLAAIIAPPIISRYDYAIIAVYLLFLVTMGWIFRRFTRGSTDYFASGHRMTWWLLGATSFVSNFSSWVFTGAANMAYTYGMLIFVFYGIDVLGFLLNYLWTAKRFRQLRLVTTMDAIRLRYGRNNEQFFTWLGFISTTGVAAVWMVSLAIILSSAFGLPVVPVIATTGVVVIVIALVGGSWAVAASDFIQLLVICSVTVVISVLTVIKVGGLGAFLGQIPAGHWQVFRPAGSIQYDWIYLVTGLLSAIYLRNNFTAAAKYIAAKDSVHAKKSALVPLIGYLVMPVFWFIPPFAAFTLVPDLPQQSLTAIPGEAAYVAVALKVLPTGMIGLFIAAMFSATISSMDVALNKNAGVFVKNFYQPVLRPNCSDRELLLAGEIATVLFGLLITGIALAMVTATQVSLFDAFLYMSAYLGIPLAIPMFLGMFVRRVPAWSAWATTLFGILTTVFLYQGLPTQAIGSVVQSLIGESRYHYLVTNKFVASNLIGLPLTIGFFCLSKIWYRPNQDADYERSTEDFFQRIEKPVNFEQEIGSDNTPAQARILGRVSCLYGAFITLLVLIPNQASGRIAILLCSVGMWSVGLGLLAYAKRRPAAPSPP